MRRAIQVTEITEGLSRELDTFTLDELVPPPPEPWYVRGPRGGLYVATGPVTRRAGFTGDDFMHVTMSVVDRSAGTRYIRPRSALAREARRQLGQ